LKVFLQGVFIASARFVKPYLWMRSLHGGYDELPCLRGLGCWIAGKGVRLLKRRMRLDLRGFQRQKLAGGVLILAVLVGSILSVYMFHREVAVAKYYLKMGEYEVSNEAIFKRVVLESSFHKPVAVMFESPTCPVCKRMAPYWAVLEKRSRELPLDFYHVMFSRATLSLFQRYGVEDTPTFIVFVRGKPVARHVGGFAGEGNVSDVMLSWARSVVMASLERPSSPHDLAEEGLRIYASRCAQCHGEIKGLDRLHVEEWRRTAARTAVNALGPVAVKALDKRFEEALSKGVYLHEVYDRGFSGLEESVLSMRKYLPDLLAYEAQRTAYLLDYLSAVAENRSPPILPWMELMNVSRPVSGPLKTGEASKLSVASTSNSGKGISAVGAVSALVAGVVSVFSPCVLPLLVAQVSVVGSSGRRLGLGSCISCGLAAAAGVVGVSALFLVAGGLASSLQQLLLPVIALAIVAAGLASLLGVPVELQGIVGAKRGGLLGFCTVYGFLAVQCNLPIVVGVLLLIAGLGFSVAGLAALLALAAGSGIPLAAVMWLVSRSGAGVAEALLKRNVMLSRIGGLVLLVAGLYLLLYGFQIV